jgi:predicted GNAT family N-acyltransferase
MPKLNPVNALEIVIKPWREASQEAYLIREQVFIQEQGVPEDMELDEFDPACKHALAYDGYLCVGTGRLVHLDSHHAQIGRMAVLSTFRSRGIGKAILSRLITLAQAEGVLMLSLHSQVSAIPFYAKHGFMAEGPVYDEAGIPHRNMMLLLPKNIE